MPVLRKLYKEAKNPVRITGKVLKDKEMEELKQVIKDNIDDIDIKWDNINELGLAGIKKAYEQNVENSETYFFKGCIRSGQKIETEGSIVILGDVNSGAEVIAGDNIVVLGFLRGLAHAGAKGNKKAIIASHKIECPQLRIANILKEIEKEILLYRRVLKSPPISGNNWAILSILIYWSSLFFFESVKNGFKS